jgi:hypothetical protein
MQIAAVALYSAPIQYVPAVMGTCAVVAISFGPAAMTVVVPVWATNEPGTPPAFS